MRGGLQTTCHCEAPDCSLPTGNAGNIASSKGYKGIQLSGQNPRKKLKRSATARHYFLVVCLGGLCMARPVAVLTPLSRPAAFLPDAWRVPLLGWLWVLFNISVVWVGITFEQTTLCALVAGSVDGMVIAIIAVAKASEKFQAAATRLLGGLGLNKVGSETNFLKTAANGIHHVVDSFMDTVIGPCSNCEDTHKKIAGALLLIIWTAIFVVFASLIGEWVRASRSENGPQQNETH